MRGLNEVERKILDVIYSDTDAREFFMAMLQISKDHHVGYFLYLCMNASERWYSLPQVRQSVLACVPTHLRYKGDIIIQSDEPHQKPYTRVTEYRVNRPNKTIPHVGLWWLADHIRDNFPRSIFHKIDEESIKEWVAP